MWNKERQEELNLKLDLIMGSLSSPEKLQKGAYFTDIHFGRRSNCSVHNQDCLDFIDFFCSEVYKDSSIDHIVFLGDWHENRTNLDLNTLNYSREGMSKLNDLGVPIFILVGNHDMRYISSRGIHSIPHFNEFSNVIVVDEPTFFPQIENGAFMCPFIFQEEYAFLSSGAAEGETNGAKTWLGHFEFKGFRITGGNTIMQSGPSIDDFSGPTKIFSGHFHKRQNQRNTFYIGNAFPMDFGDAGDFERGMAVYSYSDDNLKYIDWIDSPKYIRIKLSEFDNDMKLYKKARVECLCDIPISFEDTIAIKDAMMEKFELRDFILIDDLFIKETIEGDLSESMEDGSDGDVEFGTIDEMVISMLGTIKNETIDKDLLIDIYKEVKID